MKSLLRPQEGSAFVLVLVLIVALVSLTVAGLKEATSGLRTSNNYETGIQAQLAAEAGAVHAQKVLTDYGVVRFDSDVVPEWSTIFGTAARTLSDRGTTSYTVTATADPWDSHRYMLLDSVGQGLGDSERTVRVRLYGGAIFSPGAVYLPSPVVDATFNGNSFLVDGHDHNLDGTLNPSGDTPGITTRFEDTSADVRSSLSNPQIDNVVGEGGTPSVEWSGGMSADRISNEIVPDILARGPEVLNPPINGNDTLGTIAAPQVTHFTGNVALTGNCSGAGILIVDQGLRVTGNFAFVGLIIVRGTTEITSVSGNATLLGALWTTDLRLTVAGTASVNYSTEALELAGALFGGEILPRQVKAVSWD